MSRALRNTIAALLVAGFASLVPSPALARSRHFFDRPARIEPARGVFAWLVRLLDLATSDTGGAMDPNGGR